LGLFRSYFGFCVFLGFYNYRPRVSLAYSAKLEGKKAKLGKI